MKNWEEDDGTEYCTAMDDLADAQAVIGCEVDRLVTYGTHSIVIGAVREVRVSGEVQPLIYQDGRYL